MIFVVQFVKHGIILLKLSVWAKLDNYKPVCFIVCIFFAYLSSILYLLAMFSNSCHLSQIFEEKVQETSINDYINSCK